MAFVHEFKFFKHDDLLFCALFEAPNRYGSDYWIKNVSASDLGVDRLPEKMALEQKYSVEVLGIKPFFFYDTMPRLEFINAVAKSAWKTGDF